MESIPQALMPMSIPVHAAGPGLVGNLRTTVPSCHRPSATCFLRALRIALTAFLSPPTILLEKVT